MLMPTLRTVRNDQDTQSPSNPAPLDAHHLAQLYGTLEAAAAIGSWQYNFKLKRLTWSKGIYTLLGIPDGTAPSHDLFARFTHPDDRLPIDDMDTYLRDVRSIDREFRIIDAAGAVRPVAHKVEVFVDAKGQQTLAAGLLMDVSARVHALREREAAEKRLRAVWQSIASVTWAAEANGEVPVLQSWMDLTGQTAKEASGLGWLNAVHAADRDATRDAWLKAFATKSRYAAKYRLLCQDGRARWYLAQAVPVLDAQGNVEQWLGALINIDDLEQGQMSELDLAEFSGFTGAIMTAARALLGWSLNDLAKASGVSISTIRRIEEAETVTAKRSIMLKLIHVLRDAGVEFKREDDAGWYIRRKPQRTLPAGQGIFPDAAFRLPVR
jgi:PAS domain S-box-containing protein